MSNECHCIVVRTSWSVDSRHCCLVLVLSIMSVSKANSRLHRTMHGRITKRVTTFNDDTTSAKRRKINVIVDVLCLSFYFVFQFEDRNTMTNGVNLQSIPMLAVSVIVSHLCYADQRNVRQACRLIYQVVFDTCVFYLVFKATNLYWSSKYELSIGIDMMRLFPSIESHRFYSIYGIRRELSVVFRLFRSGVLASVDWRPLIDIGVDTLEVRRVLKFCICVCRNRYVVLIVHLRKCSAMYARWTFADVLSILNDSTSCIRSSRDYLNYASHRLSSTTSRLFYRIRSR